MDGWIKFYRKFLSWEWYSDINTKCLFLHLLLKANHKAKKWRGITIQQGQLVTGRKVLAEEIGLSEQQVRTSLLRLKSTNEITIESTRQYSIITLVKWNDYQAEQPTKQPTDNQQSTTNKNEKNINIYGEFKNVKLSESEFNKLSVIWENRLNDGIETLSTYLASKGDKYKSHYAVLGKHNWVYKKLINDSSQGGSSDDEYSPV